MNFLKNSAKICMIVEILALFLCLKKEIYLTIKMGGNYEQCTSS